MIVLIAWRNVWRSWIRTFVVLMAIITGIWALIFGMAFMYAMNIGMINNSIEHQISHIQLHDSTFKENYEIQYLLPNGTHTTHPIGKIPGVKAVTGRAIVPCWIESSRKGRGIRVNGIMPESEAAVTKLDLKITKGTYFEGVKKNPILISKKLAEELRLEIRKKPVLSIMDLNGEQVKEKFKVVGIFKTGFTKFDQMNVFILQSDLGRMMGAENGIHEIAVYLEDPNELELVKNRISINQPGLLTETWRELAPELDLIQTQIYVNMYILMGIIMFALIFGIFNTMLMVVLERVRELGMLMAIGMNKLRVFMMILVETMMFSLIGAPIGLFLGYITVSLTNKQGIDVSKFSEGLEEYGIQDLIRPELEPKLYFILAILVVVTTILASIYPAIKATRLKPSEAIQKI